MIHLFSIYQDVAEFSYSIPLNEVVDEKVPFDDMKPYIMYEKVPTEESNTQNDVDNSNSCQTATALAEEIIFDSSYEIPDGAMKCEVVSVLTYIHSFTIFQCYFNCISQEDYEYSVYDPVSRMFRKEEKYSIELKCSTKLMAKANETEEVAHKAKTKHKNKRR